ncbi:DUF1330 domain-containing protein [Sphingomonas arantia]|uniref:DUF1330 domain-containing protein n=1 Tax=Sphingomonas arantia TaxID=1460676 RepID=A0ABW4TYI6_9SPHN
MIRISLAFDQTTEITMPAYVIFIREKTVDQAELNTYRQLVKAVLEKWPVKFLSDYGAMEVVEGSEPVGVVLVEFPTMREAQDWYHSPEYQAVIRHRLAGGEYRGLIIDGL